MTETHALLPIPYRTYVSFYRAKIPAAVWFPFFSSPKRFFGETENNLEQRLAYFNLWMTIVRNTVHNWQTSSGSAGSDSYFIVMIVVNQNFKTLVLIICKTLQVNNRCDLSIVSIFVSVCVFRVLKLLCLFINFSVTIIMRITICLNNIFKVAMVV